MQETTAIYFNSGTSDVNVGDLVLIGNRVGVARSVALAPTAQNFPGRTPPSATRGVAALEGVFEVTKVLGQNIVVNSRLYWDRSAGVVTTAVGSNLPLGYAHEDSPSARVESGREVVVKTVLVSLAPFLKGDAIPDSTAASVASMVVDHNTLLANLRSAGVIDV